MGSFFATSIKNGMAVLVLTLAVFLSGCGGTATDVTDADSTAAATEAPEDASKKVLATFTVLADMAQNVAGDALVVESITRPGSEIHGYEPYNDHERQ